MATVSKGTAASSTGESLAGQSLSVGTWHGGGESDSKSDRYLAKRLAAASADYKGVALTTFLLAAAVAGFVWLACGILVEHWLLPGGLPRGARWAWLAIGGAALAAGIIRWVVPLFRYRVNLVYAARAIEQEHPELHNDLVNTVLVKAHPEASPPLVVQSLERRTAKRLSGLPAEAVVDRTTALRLAYVLAALVGLAGLYEVVAPKSLFVTAARLLAPWVGWAAPSRVRIGPPELSWRMPGEKAAGADAGGLDRRRITVDGAAATLVRGRQLVVSADIRGLRRNEQPLVMVSPLHAAGIDGGAAAATAAPGAAAWQAEMVRGESAAGLRDPADSGSGRRFAVVLPDNTRGLDLPVEIVIAAGDARSEPVRIAVVDSPALLVREVRYDYPAYTRKQGESVEWQGDIRAVEGTQVTIIAESNQPLEDAWIDFDCDGDHDLKFTKKANDLARVTRSFPLQMNADRTGPEHAIYKLLFRPRAASAAGREAEVVEPMEHRIEVIADLAPEVSIEEPRESPVRVPPAAAVAIRVRALDPDFALARVGIETRLQGGPIQPEITLLAEEKPGAFKGVVRLVPERLGAGPGSVLEYRAVAVDTRPKTPNVSHSPWQSLQIDASAPPRAPEEPAPQSGGQQGEQTGEQHEGDRKGDPGSEEAAGDDDQQARKEGDAAADPADDQEQPLDNRQQQPGQQQAQGKPQPEEREKQQQKKQEQQNGPQGAAKPGDQSGAAEGSQQGGKQETPGQSQRGGKQGAGENQGQGADQGQGAGAQGDRSGGRQSGKQQSEKGESEKAGDKNGGGNEAGGRDAAGAQGAAKKPAAAGEAQRGDKKQPNPAVASDGTNDGEAMERILEHRRQEGGSEKSGSEKSGSEKSGSEKSGSEKSGSEKSGGEKSGGEKSGGEKSGGEKSGGEKSGGEKSGGEKSGGEKQQQNQPSCAGSDGKPCGKEGCSSCAGGGNPGNAGGKQSGGKQAGGETVAGEQPESKSENKGQNGEQKHGVEESEQPGQGKQSQGQGQGQGQPADEGAQSQAGESVDGDQRKDGAPQDGQQPAPGAGPQPGSEGSSNAERGGSGTGQSPDGKRGPAGGQSPPPATGKTGASSSETGSGGWSGGDGPSQPGKPPADGPAPAKETEWGEQDLANARNAANLAVEHLRNAVESGRTDVLDQLGWTREQARAFLDRWEKMRSLADSGDPVQRGEFERAVRSLGLRPEGVRSSRDVPSDVKGGQSEGRRSRPPSDYREQFKAYTQGTAGE